MTESRQAVLDREQAAAAFRTVHVVTVTHNSVSTLTAFLEGVAASATWVDRLTIVDNASADDSVASAEAAMAGFPIPLEVVRNENAGFAGGYAAAAASGAPRGIPVLCLNPDVVLAPGAVEGLLDVLNSFPDAGVVTMPLVEGDGTPDTASRRTLPTLHGSVVYSLLGRLTPRALRYNRLEPEQAPSRLSAAGRAVSQLEATTGALMLVHPSLRTLDEGIFDREYWMYGEDLQLCADAASSGRSVLMAEVPPSVHIKGVSSGRPRSRRSNVAFHDAMYRYARKNLVSNPLALAIVGGGVWGHFVVSEARAVPVRIRRRFGSRR